LGGGRKPHLGLARERKKKERDHLKRRERGIHFSGKGKGADEIKRKGRRVQPGSGGGRRRVFHGKGPRENPWERRGRGPKQKKGGGGKEFL